MFVSLAHRDEDGSLDGDFTDEEEVAVEDDALTDEERRFLEQFQSCRRIVILSDAGQTGHPSLTLTCYHFPIRTCPAEGSRLLRLPFPPCCVRVGLEESPSPGL